jgi:hypothetical protein
VSRKREISGLSCPKTGATLYFGVIMVTRDAKNLNYHKTA